jgi:hypothetical protein
MQYIPVFFLIAEAALSFYKYLAPSGYFGPSVLDLILGVIFVILAFAAYKNAKNKLLQWAAIIISLLLGPGGFIGFGGLFALLLAFSFVVLSKKAKSY